MNNTLKKLQNGFAKAVFSKKASIISGIVCAIPFVFEYTFLLSYIAYVPLFCLFFKSDELKANGKKVLLRVFLFGFFYFAVGYSWLAELYPMDYAGFTPTEALGVIVFALTAIPAIHSGLLTLSFAVCNVLTKKSGTLIKVAAFPCIFVFSEFLQTLGPLAFPWCKVSVAQSAFLPMIQSASLFGSYFITYLVLLINAFVGICIMKPDFAKKSLIAACAFFLVNLSYGTLRLVFFTESDSAFTATALQGNISSQSKWSGSTSEMLDEYLALTDEALAEAKAENMPENVIAVMPETALPVTLIPSSTLYGRVSEYADSRNISLAVGAFSKEEEGISNSIFMFDSDGNTKEPYKKRILVPFGEYMPYRTLLTAIVPALGEINMLSSDLVPGTDTNVFETPSGRVGTAICYESIFHDACRKSVKEGAEILIVSTNDSWFGESGALRHHLANARLLAIENNVPVIRAANTGISALINPDGTYEEILGMSVKGQITAVLHKGSGTTLYTRIGDIMLLLCLCIILCNPVKRVARIIVGK